jgi:UDP-N-acetylglucosamine 1-carboxyvinyltransferase
MGAKISIEGGYVFLKSARLKGANIYLDFPSVGATENLMLAAVCASGKTVIENAACEPEISDLADMLSKMGSCIKGAGTSIVEIEGKASLKGARHTVIPDRIEAGTFMVAAAITRGDVLVKNARPGHMEAFIGKLRDSGVSVSVAGNDIRIRATKSLKSQDIKTSPFPGFPTDMQAQWMALMSTVKGSSIITEAVFENRFLHVAELCRMGADIQVEGNSAFIKGVGRLSGAPVMASDLRASAALVIAGLFAGGKTEISRVYHLDRGYEKIENKLRKLGADIKRVKDN